MAAVVVRGAGVKIPHAYYLISALAGAWLLSPAATAARAWHRGVRGCCGVAAAPSALPSCGFLGKILVDKLFSHSVLRVCP